MKKRVCIIGGGASGITTIKQMIDEGHEPVCYEKSADMGGVFLYQKHEGAPSEDKRLINGVYKNTTLTISNYLMCFSDLPPEGERRHWHHSEYMDYLRKYVANFGLNSYIQLNSTVVKVTPKDDGESGYTVHVSDLDNTIREEHYDAIAICTGTHQIPSTPKIEGMDKYKGEVLHAAKYDNNDVTTGKRVLCVGIGESSADITREVSENAKECHLALRSYPFLIPRNLNHSSSDSWTSRLHHDYHTPKNEGILSYLLLSLYHFFLKSTLFLYKKPKKDSFLQCTNERALDLNTPGYAEYVKLIKSWNYLSKGRRFATKNVTFVPNIINGLIKVNASGIARFTENSVIFNDGESKEVDMVLFATGYHEDFNFLEGFQLQDNSVRNLFMNSIPTNLKNCAFIGWARPVTGGIPACSEAAARYFSLLLAGKVCLPKNIYERIEEDKEFYIKFYSKNSPGVNTVVAWKRHMENYADLIGCTVNPLRYALQPSLFVRLFAGSLVPFQYRLQGPHAMKETAKEAILSMPITLPKEHITLGIKLNLKNKISHLRKNILTENTNIEYSQMFSEWFRHDVPITLEDIKRFSYRNDNFIDKFDTLVD